MPDAKLTAPFIFLNGTGPGIPEDPGAALPESVEAQTRNILANLDGTLERDGLDRGHVIAVRIHLTQFARFEQRVARVFDSAFPADAGPSVGWIGVEALPREALIEIDFVISRERRTTQ